MKNTYDEFINSLGIISEGDFVGLMTILPDEDIDFDNINWTDYFFYTDDLNSIGILAEAIINEILNQWDYAYCYEVDVEAKTFNLEDCCSLDDLNEITETFKEWKISNFEEIKEDLKEKEMSDIRDDKHIEYNELFNSLSLEEIDEILEKYGNKG